MFFGRICVVLNNERRSRSQGAIGQVRKSLLVGQVSRKKEVTVVWRYGGGRGRCCRLKGKKRRLTLLRRACLEIPDLRPVFGIWDW